MNTIPRSLSRHRRGLLLPLLPALLAAATFARGPCAAADPPQTMTLIAPGEDVPDIFVDLRASPPEKFAARELRGYLERMTGREITIRSDYWVKDAPAGRHIVVGQCRFSADLDS